MIKHKQYVSDLTFYSDIQLLAAHKALLNLQKGISEITFEQPLEYDITRLDFDFDKIQKPLKPDMDLRSHIQRSGRRTAIVACRSNSGSRAGK